MEPKWNTFTCELNTVNAMRACIGVGMGMLVVSQQHVKSRMYTYFPSVILVVRRIFYKNSRLFARLL